MVRPTAKKNKESKREEFEKRGVKEKMRKRNAEEEERETLSVDQTANLPIKFKF